MTLQQAGSLLGNEDTNESEEKECEDWHDQEGDDHGDAAVFAEPNDGEIELYDLFHQLLSCKEESRLSQFEFLKRRD